MAKFQRGASKPKTEKAVKVREEMSESSEDEGPEEVAFDESKSAALKTVKEALQSAKREKELLKEKRRKRQLFFQEQKKKRLLPETLLEEFDAEVPQKQKKPSDDKDEKKEEENVEIAKPKKKAKSLQGNCSVMRVKDECTDASLQQSAMNFIQARFYGPGTRRTTTAQLLSLERKKGAKQGAALQFVNNKWGADLKAKAEKSNKRFIHKQMQIPS